MATTVGGASIYFPNSAVITHLHISEIIRAHLRVASVDFQLVPLFQHVLQARCQASTTSAAEHTHTETGSRSDVAVQKHQTMSCNVTADKRRGVGDIAKLCFASE